MSDEMFDPFERALKKEKNSKRVKLAWGNRLGLMDTIT